MDIAFDRKGWAGNSRNMPDTVPATPDWHGLRARLWATRQAHLSFGEELRSGVTIASLVAAGSFDRSSARMLADYEPGLAEINLAPWANRKPDRTKAAGVAGAAGWDERGTQ